MNAQSLIELQQLVEAALARHGTAGEVRVDERNVTLLGTGPAASWDITSLAARWQGLSLTERQNECALIARSLTRTRRAELTRAPRRQARSFGWMGVAALLLMGAAAYHFRAAEVVEEPAEGAARRKAAAGVEADSDDEREARAERVCNATRTRLARGGTVGPTDAEGWVVELSLVRGAEGPGWASMEGFLTSRAGSGEQRLAWSGAPELSELSGPNTRVEVRDEALPEGAAPEFRELSLTLHGEYVLPYFREAERIKLIRFAHALGEKQSARLGALYARCARGSAHHMGSWFLGTSPGAAASALLYYMGAHAYPPLLPRELLSTREEVTVEPAFALSTLLERTRHMQKQDIASGIGAQDGMVAGPPHFTTLGFPFVDSDRALRASYALGRALPAPRAPR